MIEIKHYLEPDLSLLPDNIPKILRRVYINRKITDVSELVTSVKMLHSYHLLNMQDAVQLLFTAIKDDLCIVIVGDFDTDGATSTALSVCALKMLGARHVKYLIPNRFEHGYGLSCAIVDQAIELGAQVIITVDNGISSIDGTAHAKQRGVTVIITDHHLPPTTLPNADAIINPNLNNCAFPSKSLAGVGVSFYFMMALCVYMREQNWFAKRKISEPKLMELTDLVALGTVADVVALDQNNRILIHQGLQRIRAGKARIGILALIESAKRDASKINAEDLSFAVAPRLNAAGRLDEMSQGVELLLTDDFTHARYIARNLEDLNQSRKEIEQSMKMEALDVCAKLRFNADNNGDLPAGLVVYNSDWHQGVIGILAARIKDQYHRPVIAFAKSTDEYIKGSARSIARFHLKDALEMLAQKHPNLLVQFGGHAMAAGVTIREHDFTLFSSAFSDLVAQNTYADDFKGIIMSDGELSLDMLTLKTAEQLKNALPFGQSFPSPIFDGTFNILQQKLIADKHLKLIVEPVYPDQTKSKIFDAIAFNVDKQQWMGTNITQARIAYKLGINEFRGVQSLQLIIEHIAI